MVEEEDLHLFSGSWHPTLLIHPFCSPFSLPPEQPASSVDTQMHSPKKQERVKKRVIWGIEVAEELHWKGWELGKETTRNLVLKNRSLKLQKMKYRYQYKGSRTQCQSIEP